MAVANDTSPKHGVLVYGMTTYSEAIENVVKDFKKRVGTLVRFQPEDSYGLRSAGNTV